MNGDRVRIAREFRGLAQTEVAAKLQIDQSTIAHIESGRLQPSDALLEAMAFQMGFPPAFFRQTESASFPLGSLLLFRARKTVTGREETRARRCAQLMYECADRLSSRFRPLPVRLPAVSESPATAAGLTKDALGISAEEPVPNLVRALERAGVLVLSLPVELAKVDAFAVWAGEGESKPVIALTRERPGDRMRRSTAHEVGHLVLHQSVRGDVRSVEAEADQFAAELLMPESAMREELSAPLTINSLLALKARWKVSIQSLVMRAAELELLTARQKTYFFQQLSRAGWRTTEPIPIPPEEPGLLNQMAHTVYGSPIDYRAAANDTRLPESLLREFFADTLDVSNVVPGLGEKGNILRFQA